MMNHYKIHPDAVNFDEIVCCAFASVYRRTAQPSIRIFVNTIRICFVPRECDKKNLLRIAEEEIERLEKPGKELECDHLKAEHVSALKQIIYVLMSKLRDKYKIK